MNGKDTKVPNDNNAGHVAVFALPLEDQIDPSSSKVE